MPRARNRYECVRCGRRVENGRWTVEGEVHCSQACATRTRLELATSEECLTGRHADCEQDGCACECHAVRLPEREYPTFGDTGVR